MAAVLRGIPSDKDFIASLSQAVGFLGVNFGLFEFALNAIIATIHQRIAQPIKGRGQLPYTLKERLRYVREAANHYSPLVTCQEELRHIASEAKRLSIIRNGVLHGSIADYDSPTHMLTFVGMIPSGTGKDMHQETRYALSIQALLAGGIDAEALCTKTNTFCLRLMKQIDT